VSRLSSVSGNRWHKCQNSLTIRAVSLFFCRAYFPPVYWARHKTHAEPKLGRSQNGPASNRENLPQSGFTLASAILDGIKEQGGFCSETRPTMAVASACVAA
jgi:hypothetical protein